MIHTIAKRARTAIVRWPGVAAAVACGLGSTIALAQENDELAEVVVTGTSIRGVAPVGSEAVTLGREEIAATGLNQPAEILNLMPQVHNLGSPGGANGQRGQVINLRGLGANATLVLVDGRRLVPSGTTGNFLEANQVPASALERIEVVADGQSAIYGSDAVAGVVNYVLRKDLNGVEVGVRYKRAATDYDEKGATVLAGTTWSGFAGLGNGNVVVSYEYTDQSPMLEGSSPFLRQDLRAFGGNDARLLDNSASVASTAGNIIVGPGAPNSAMPSAGNYTYYGLTPGITGVPTAASVLARVNQPNLTDSSFSNDYLNAQKRHQGTVFLNQSLTENLDLFYQGFFGKRDSVQRTYQTANIFGRRLCVLPGTPYYINGLYTGAAATGCTLGGGSGPPDSYEVQYNFSKDFGYGNSTYYDNTYTHTLGLRLGLAGDWRAELYATQGRSSSCGMCVLGVFPNMDAMQNQVNLGNINPYSSEPLTAAQLATFLGDNRQTATNRLRNAALKLDGSVFEVPGGMVRAALGVEYNDLRQRYLNGANRGIDNVFTLDTTTEASRNVKAAYAEVFVPVVGPSQAVPFVKSLSVDVAVRTEDYSDFGRTTNPKVGLTWAWNDSVSLRGSWGKAFRAPDLPGINPGTLRILLPAPQLNAVTNIIPPSFCAPQGCFSTMLLAIGSNPDLGPERAETWSFGADLRPAAVPGLRGSFTFYSVDYTDRIVAPLDNYTDTPEHYALYSKYVILTPAPAGCVNGNRATYNPAILPWLDEVNLFGPPSAFWDVCSIQAVLNRFSHNDASTRQRGLDINLGYGFDTRIGTLNIDMAVSKILSAKQVLIPGGAETDASGRINYPVDLRGRGGVGWTRGAWGADLHVNYVGDYTNDLPITVGGVRQPVSLVPAWTTVDAGLRYQTDEDAGFWLGGIRLALTAQNILGRDPPVVLSTASTYAFDAQNAQVFGRIWQLQVSKAF